MRSLITTKILVCLLYYFFRELRAYVFSPHTQSEQCKLNYKHNATIARSEYVYIVSQTNYTTANYKVRYFGWVCKRQWKWILLSIQTTFTLIFYLPPKRVFIHDTRSHHANRGQCGCLLSRPRFKKLYLSTTQLFWSHVYSLQSKFMFLLKTRVIRVKLILFKL